MDTRPDVNEVTLIGTYEIKVKRNRKVICSFKGKNLITTSGEVLMAKLLDPDQSPNEPEFCALGSGTATPLKSDTTLGVEIAGTRTIKTTATVIGSALQLVFALTATAPWSMREAGIFNAISSGDMTSRFLTQVVNLAIDDVVDIVWTLTISGVD